MTIDVNTNINPKVTILKNELNFITPVVIFSFFIKLDNFIVFKIKTILKADINN